MWVSGTQDSGSIPDRTTNPKEQKLYFVYILQSEVDCSYYKGHTNDLADRIKRHNRKEEEYSYKLAPWILVWCCMKPTKSEAYKLEMKLKNLGRQKTAEFIEKYRDEDLIKRFRP